MFLHNSLLKPKISNNYNHANNQDCFNGFTFIKAVALRIIIKNSVKLIKGRWWMPWVVEAMKDALDCDKLWGAVKKL